MTFRELLHKFEYTDIVPYVEREVRRNEDDRRPHEVKMEEMERGFAGMKALKPTFGYIDTRIEVGMTGGRLSVGNTHIGSASDLLSRQIAVAPEVVASEKEILAGCIYQLVAHEASWVKYRDDDDFDDLDSPMMSRGMR